ncbi:uncharacterized protein HMPREF1541_02335 [Cyphellophora europaea CBS 101466]|uniref:TatD family hydrolase n=1 Tax=Cyphellophora europaea (strain CBS 101466) TaxID=1220924 RepID=W2S3A8_CYPE1|nr:uncharacterized protein HMPREF1541_02335 [Cyphellophora europaea CBS 101466]ETN43177.1 hypothetical protein HMPREF1541_02335 [Cyphellophora europaea CBS 101466]
MSSSASDEKAMWEAGVFDAHCHPTDIMASIQDIASMNAQALTVMASRREDQDLVVDTADRYAVGSKGEAGNRDRKAVVPAFGWHPWFSYQMYDDRNSPEQVNAIEHYRAVLTPAPEDDEFLKSLPEVVSLARYLDETSARLERFPLALVGEIGLDRAFRLPRAVFVSAGDLSEKTGGSKEEYTPGSREGRPLTPYRVGLDHQKVILKAQFELAGKYKRPVSVHSVQTHGAIFDLLQELWKGNEKPSKREQKRQRSSSNLHPDDHDKQTTENESPRRYPPRICMHSYSGPPDALKQFLANTVPADIYFSFSICINFSTPAAAKAEAVIKALPDDRILVESDFHCAGEKMDQLLKEIVLKICEIKGWQLLQGVQQLKRNWKKFVFG